MRRWSVWTFASTWGQGTPCHDVISGIRGDAIDSYLAAFATPLLVTSIPQQTVPTSAASSIPRLSREHSLLGQSFPRPPYAGLAAPEKERRTEVTSFPQTVWR